MKFYERFVLVPPRATVYVPDFFILFFYITLFCSSLGLDIFILSYLIFHKNLIITVTFAFSVFLHSIFELALERINQDESCFRLLPGLYQLLLFIFYLVGFGSLLVTLRALKLTFENDEAQVKPFPESISYPFFHIADENLAVIKVYCFMNVVLKCIPQFFISSIFILERYVTGVHAFALSVNILLNIFIFCQMMATTLPFRRFPRVFLSCHCIMLNGFSKFMATMCACCVNLLIFVMVFKNIKYYAIVIVLMKCLLWVWPTMQALKAQPIPYCKVVSVVFFVFMNLIFGFIYIHPFEKLGVLHYHFFYLLGSVYEIFVIYLLTAAEVEFVSCYLLLKLLMVVFLLSFALLNNQHKIVEGESVFYVSAKKSSVEPTDTKPERKEHPEIQIEKVESNPKTHSNLSEVGGSHGKPSTSNVSSLGHGKSVSPRKGSQKDIRSISNASNLRRSKSASASKSSQKDIRR